MEEKPVILRQGVNSLEDLVRLRAEKRVWREKDIYKNQCEELFEITYPERIGTPDFKEARAAFVETRLAECKVRLAGNWVYFPWSGVLLHTVKEEEYARLRTNRNRNLITEEEQRKLADSCVGLVGLSVGSNVAAALVYGGIAKRLKLAEFDVLETTNLNRVRGRLEHIGMKKSQMVAQQLYEVDPYLQLVHYEEKMSAGNLREFFRDEPRPQVVFEIMDSFEVKLQLRAFARDYGVPVIMVTNLGDRVLMDIERYDIDKNIEYFNGRAGSVPRDILERPDVNDALKHQYAVALAGVEHIPQRALDSVAEIGKTLVGRPQLASTVALAAGFGAYCTRKIILGEPLPSRSWLVDLEKIFSEPNAL